MKTSLILAFSFISFSVLAQDTGRSRFTCEAGSSNSQIFLDTIQSTYK
jgi:hypothetical protein